MTNAILRGKSDAGNPHVRFDEGEVASAKTRHGSLLYKTNMLLIGLCTLVPAASFAAEITSTGANDGGGKSSFNQGTNWSDGKVPEPGNTYRWIGGVFRTPAAAGTYRFAGDRITFAGGSVAHKTYGESSFVEFPDAVIEGKNLCWSLADSGKTARVGGNITVKTAKATPFKFGVLQGTSSIYILESRFSGERGTGILFSHTSGSNKPDDITCTFRLLGDNSAYQGNYQVANVAQYGDERGVLLVLENAKAIGDEPVEPMADAIALSNGGALAISPELCVAGPFAPVNRGVQLTGLCRFATVSNEMWSTAMPVSGTGDLHKTGAGTVQLCGPYSAGGIVIEDGTLVLSTGFTAPDGLSVQTSGDGARLVAKSTSAEGLSLRNVALPDKTEFSVYVDSSTHKAGTIEIDANCTMGEGPYVVELAGVESQSESVTYPVLSVPASVRELAAEDIVMADDGLPYCDLSVEIKDGLQTVLATVRPVVKLSNEAVSGGSGWYVSKATTWEDGLVPTAEKDYFAQADASGVLRTSDGNGDYTFTGGSLSLAPQVTFAMKSVNFTVPKLVLHSGSLVNAAGNNQLISPQCISGKIVVASDAAGATESPAVSGYASLTGQNGQFLLIAADVSGTGDLAVTPYGNNHFNVTTFSGDNSRYTGRFFVAPGRAAQTGADVSSTLAFTRPEALGGSIPKLYSEGVRLGGSAYLKPLRSMTYATQNRYIRNATEEDGIIVDRDEDGNLIEFKFKGTICYTGRMRKLGVGTMALGGTTIIGTPTWNAWNSDTGTRGVWSIEEGAVKPLNTAAFERLKFVFGENGMLAVDAEAEDAAVAQYGMFTPYGGGNHDGKDLGGAIVLAEGNDRLTVRIDGVKPEMHGRKIPFMTVAKLTADEISDKISFRKVGQGLRAKLVQDTVTIKNVEYTRFSAELEVWGSMIIVR